MCFQVNSFVGAFHDAVILYALALNETLAANISITNGTEITKRMWNRTFEGKVLSVILLDSKLEETRIADVRFIPITDTLGLCTQ